jgi:hypothetical protein
MALLIRVKRLVIELGLNLQSGVLLRGIVAQLVVLETEVPPQRRLGAVETVAVGIGAVVPFHNLFRTSPFTLFYLLLLPLLQSRHRLKEVHHNSLLLLRVSQVALEISQHFLESLILLRGTVEGERLGEGREAGTGGVRVVGKVGHIAPLSVFGLGMRNLHEKLKYRR